MPDRARLLPVLLAAAAVAAMFVASPWGPLDDVLWSRAPVGDDTAAPIELAADDEQAPVRPTLHGLPEIDPSADRGPVIVTVRGAHGIPLDGVLVRLVTGKSLVELKGKTFFGEGQKAVAEVVTDAVGICVFADVPYDRSHLVGLRAAIGRAEADLSGPTISAPILLDDFTSGLEDNNQVSYVDFHAVVDGPEVTLSARVGLPFDVRVEAADTGRLVPGATWRAGLRFVGAKDELPKARGRYIAAELSQHMNVPMTIDPGRGYVLDGDPRLEGYFHPQATRVIAVVPVRPEVEVTVVPPEGVALRDEFKQASVIFVSGGPYRIELDGFGRVSIGGLPHLQGEHLTVQFQGTDERTFVGSVVMGRRPMPLVIELGPAPEPALPEPEKIDAEPAEIDDDPFEAVEPMEVEPEDLEAASATDWEEIDLFIHSDFYSSSSITGTNLDLKDWYTIERDVDVPSGRVLVQIYRPDGQPAAGALANLDDEPDFLYARQDGKLFFQGVPPGEYRLSALGAGAALEIPLTVTADETTHVTHHATWGGKIDLTVVDENGDPVPYARLSVGQPSQQFWTCVVDGVQRIDRFTDARGKRRIESVEVGPVVVAVTFGSRSASKTIQVVDGQTVALTLALGGVETESAFEEVVVKDDR